MRQLRILPGIITLLLAFGGALAQAPLPAEARAALDEGEARMAEALATYPAQYPDRLLWKQAFAAGRRSASLAPDRLEPVRFLAGAYSRSNWPGPAWNAWEDYLQRGGVLDDEAQALAADVGRELGYGAYARGDLAGSFEFYRRVTELAPADVESRVWVARILMETDRPEQAVPFWRSVLERDPADTRASYFLELAQDQAEWGVPAIEVFRQGVAFYERGEFPAARERFALSTVLNPAFAAGWAWLGRVAFEAGAYTDARRAYANASGLEPGNETYRYFLSRSIAAAGE